MTWYFDKKTLGFPNSDASGERTLLIPDPDWVYDPERDEDTTPPLVRIANPDCKLPPDEQLIALSEEDYRYLFDGITRGMRAVLDENQKPILIAAPQAPPLTQEAVEANRMRAYAHPITGTDRLFSEVLRMQNMGESDWEAVRDKAIERFNEIQVQFPWPEENTRKQ
ncbi:hypothetical protein GHO45_25590 [Pseudomonas sp. FSL R10-0765]|uniref:Uncharacterized protein n=1 Tax=uncultured Caudovirales phage TaxID=2100421 RepID=A0A2H4J880_9CAUD|nr:MULTISPECIES: hypothetical protein [unclassified Pseudomonas]ASN71465.1 hypothetical protein 9F1_7 [uncultured Caudovirales phage]MQT44289.1 hypothetical protein [Pseudomonas sp. FSL R10-0765]MQU03454.1 hypothetical protein [Pseudomonas sp. FSL R10-2245]